SRSHRYLGNNSQWFATPYPVTLATYRHPSDRLALPFTFLLREVPGDPPAMISLLIRLLLITIGCTWAQDGYYQSAGDLRKIENPDQIFQSEFIWRSQIKDSFQFFQIELNNLLYNNKNIYLW